MVLIHMLARFKSLLLSLITLFRRALCCISRRRKSSYSDCEILTSVNVVQGSNNKQYQNESERDWNSWDDSPRTVTEHIEQYRQKLAQPKAVDENDEPKIDFFQDMTPKVVKQKKVFVDPNKNTNSGENFSRLQPTSAAYIPHVPTADLEDWSDENEDDRTAGWDEVNDEVTKQMIREKRREARAQRNQRLLQQKQQQQQMQSGLYAHH